MTSTRPPDGRRGPVGHRPSNANARPSGPRPQPLPGRRPHDRRGGRSRAWPIALTLVGVIIAAVAGTGAYLALAFPEQVVRDRVVAEVKARTGRDLIIKGAASFAAVPSATVSLHDVTLPAPPAMKAAPVVTIKNLEVRVAWMPLLWREVVVEHIVLNEPVFHLTIDADGRRSWDLDRESKAEQQGERLRLAPAAATTDSATEPQASSNQIAVRKRPLPDVSLQDVRIVNGTLRLVDARAGATRDFSAIAARLAVKSLQQPADAEGSFVYRGEKVDFDIELGAVEPLFAHTPARVALKLSSRPLTAAYEGTILVGGNEAAGALTARAPSAARAAAWLGGTLPANANLGALDFAGQLRLSGRSYTLSHATLNLNGTAATGDITLDTGPARPLLRGHLETAELNLNTLISPTLPPAAPDPPAVTPQSDPVGAAPGQQGATTNGTRVNGFASRGGWSEDPIRLTALAAADADLKITVGRLLYRDLKVGKSRLAVAIDDRLLQAKLEELTLYGGLGSGVITLDARTPETPHVGVDLAFNNVAIRPLLQDAAKLNWLDGHGQVRVTVSGTGSHQRALVESLSGTAELNVAKGAIVGIDINRMAESLSQGKFKNLKTEPGDKTAFSGLAGTWSIKDGVATNTDLRVTSDLVHVEGSGSVLLPDRSLDYVIKPRLATDPQSDGKGLAGLAVPVHITGAWEKPDYKADVGGAVQELGRRLKGKNAGEIVDELVGKDEKGQSKAKKLLDKLFR